MHQTLEFDNQTNQTLVFDKQTNQALVFDTVFYRVSKPIHVTEWSCLIVCHELLMI